MIWELQCKLWHQRNSRKRNILDWKMLLMFGKFAHSLLFSCCEMQRQCLVLAWNIAGNFASCMSRAVARYCDNSCQTKRNCSNILNKLNHSQDYSKGKAKTNSETLFLLPTEPNSLDWTHPLASTWCISTVIQTLLIQDLVNNSDQ